MSHRIQNPDIAIAHEVARSEEHSANLEPVIAQLRAENSRLTLKLKASADESRRQAISLAHFHHLSIAASSAEYFFEQAPGTADHRAGLSGRRRESSS